MRRCQELESQCSPDSLCSLSDEYNYEQGDIGAEPIQIGSGYPGAIRGKPFRTPFLYSLRRKGVGVDFHVWKLIFERVQGLEHALCLLARPHAPYPAHVVDARLHPGVRPVDTPLHLRPGPLPPAGGDVHHRAGGDVGVVVVLDGLPLVVDVRDHVRQPLAHGRIVLAVHVEDDGDAAPQVRERPRPAVRGVLHVGGPFGVVDQVLALDEDALELVDVGAGQHEIGPVRVAAHALHDPLVWPHVVLPAGKRTEGPAAGNRQRHGPRLHEEGGRNTPCCHGGAAGKTGDVVSE